MLDVALEHEEILRFSEDVVLCERVDICLCSNNLAVKLVFARARRGDSASMSTGMTYIVTRDAHVR